MRWPIQFQLLLPMLAVVVIAVVLSASVSSYLEAAWARRQIHDNLQRVVSALTGANFPLTEQVLVQMSGLSGADFLLLDEEDHVVSASFQLSANELAQLKALPTSDIEDFSQSPTVTIDGTIYLAGRVPVARHVPGSTLLVLYPERRWWGARREAAYAPIVAGLVAGLTAIVLTTILSRRFVKPITKLQQQTEAIAAGNFAPLTLGDRNDEIRDLGLSINRMAEQLRRYEDEVRRNERLRTLATLGAGMAHQLRNWVTGARMAVQHHLRELPDDVDHESIEIAQRQLVLMGTYLERFLKLGAESVTGTERLELDELVAEVVSLVRPACEHAKIELTYAPPTESIAIQGDPDALRQLLVNLLLNAVDAASGHERRPGKVTVGLDSSPSGNARLKVCDTGPGPSTEVRDRIFEPFVSEKPDGTGLGLPVARQVAVEHHGKLDWHREDNWTCFIVELPALPVLAEAAAHRSGEG